MNYLIIQNISKIINTIRIAKINTLSTILYLSDIYNISIIIYYNNKYYKLCEKKREELHIEYNNNNWNIVEKKDNKCKGELTELKDIINLNVNTLDIYNCYLKSINKYKVGELVKIATENNIPIEKEGKRKIKKELYDDINQYF